MRRKLTPRRIVREARRVLRKLGRRVAGTDRRVVRLTPPGPLRGSAIVSFVIDPFLLAPGREPDLAHTHDWESREMARALVELGYQVDALHWTNTTWQPDPACRYDLLLDVRLNLERLAPQLPDSCLRLFHAETAHRSVHDAAQLARHAALEQRRGIRLAPNRLLEANRAVETADAMTYLGNEFTRASYAFADKPSWRVPISNPLTYPFPTRTWERARRRFLWFGSGGLVHKGLDLVLEAFAAMPDLELVVAGPVENERAFEAAFARELYGTPSIEAVGWLDVSSPRFREVTAGCAAVIYPSCSEGGGGSVITCMHAGLIPVLTASSSVDLDPRYGRLIEAGDVASVQRAARELATLPAETLESMARAAWEHARATHTRASFARDWRAALAEILGRREELVARRLELQAEAH